MSEGPLSFDAIIQADRKKKQHEQLAAQILGSGRRKAAGASIDRRATASPSSSLASRVGITKRSSSTSITTKSSLNGKWNHDLHETTRNAPSGPRATAPRLPRTASNSAVERGSRMYASLQKDLAGKSAPQAQARTHAGPQMSIRGMASSGPYVVIASNFAHGTTAADIEAAMAPVGGEITSCALITKDPTVMAEILFVEREGAENVIATFNNQRADGSLLYVYMKQGGPTPNLHTFVSTSAHAPPSTSNSAVETARAPVTRDVQPVEDPNVMEVDEEEDLSTVPAPVASSAPAIGPRADARQPRSDDRNSREQPRYGDGRSRGSYQDGRQGFRASYDRRDDRRDDRQSYARGGRGSGGLYSDGYARRDYGGYRG